MENNFLYKLDDFEGPLDLLLQLIARNKLNIYDIKLSVLIEQYLEQIEIMQRNDADIASEFLEMASRLIYLKTAKLLPKHEEYERLKDEFCGELIEYQTCRRIAAMLGEQTGGFDKFVREQLKVELPKTYGLTHEKEVIFDAYISAVGRGQRKLPPPTTAFTRIVAKKIVAVSTKIVYVMRLSFKELMYSQKSRSEVVAAFLAVLELSKVKRIILEDSGDGSDTTLVLSRKKEENDR